MNQLSPPVRLDKPVRLASLRPHIGLDRIYAEQLDQLTRLAASIFAVPIALISIMDENTQWIVGSVGLALKSIDRKDFFCQYTLMGQTVVEVENTLTDSRFCTNPLVLEHPHIRYYCGAPLISEDGYLLGSIAILDTVIRKLTKQQQKTLLLLAQQVIDIFALQQKKKQLKVQHRQVVVNVGKEKGRKQGSSLHSLSQEPVKAYEALFSTIFRLNPFPTAITSLHEGKILDVNQQALKAFGYSYEEVIHLTTAQLDIWQNPKEREELMRRLEQEQRVQGFEATFRTKQGRLWTAVNSMEVIGLEGESCILWIMQDITGRKKAEEDIKAYTRQLESLNESKDKFFSVIAHDLLSPLNGILGSSNLLSNYLESLSSQEIQELAQAIYLSTENLKRLLSNLLEWARMQTGALAFQPKLIHLKQIITEAVTLLEDNARNKAIVVEIHLPEDICLPADENMMQSILRNLLSNAIKFSAMGTCITLSAEVEPEYVQVSIQDQGVGMSEEALAQLFRGGSPYTTLGTAKEKGTGLGLMLCKEFVEKHGGTLWVESSEGQGSRFTFTLAREIKTG